MKEDFAHFLSVTQGLAGYRGSGTTASASESDSEKADINRHQNSNQGGIENDLIFAHVFSACEIWIGQIYSDRLRKLIVIRDLQIKQLFFEC
jgi:hypothetical protein